jgi:formate-dependent nitrite reductase cytochrome c552 subunit
MDILRLNPSIKVINIFDDMDEQIARFQIFKEQHPEYEVNIYQI